MCCTSTICWFERRKTMWCFIVVLNDRKITCFLDLYSVHILLRCRPWKLKGLFAILKSKTTKKGLHSQYLYTLGWFCWPWKGGVGVGEGRVVGGGGGGCDTTFGPDRKTRWFSNGWLLRIRCYSVLQSHFFLVFKAKCQGFFPPEVNVTNRFGVHCTVHT